MLRHNAKWLTTLLFVFINKLNIHKGTVDSNQTWNDLPDDVSSAESLTKFRRLLKTHLFRKSFPDYLLDIK